MWVICHTAQLLPVNPAVHLRNRRKIFGRHAAWMRRVAPIQCRTVTPSWRRAILAQLMRPIIIGGGEGKRIISPRQIATFSRQYSSLFFGNQIYVYIVKKRKENLSLSFFMKLLSVCSRRVFPIAIFRLASQHRKVRATLALVCVKVSRLFNFVGHWTLLSMPRNRCQCHINTRKFLMYSNLIHLISLAYFMTFLLYLIA